MQLQNGIPAGAIDLSQVQQQQQMAQNMIADLNMNVSLHIFAKQVADWFRDNPDAPPENAAFQSMADRARLVAPFLAASYGFIKYGLTVTESEPLAN